GGDLDEGLVERDDASPVGLRRRARAGVARGDRGLQGVEAVRSAERLGAREGGEAALDEEAIPAAAILLEQEDRLARRADARRRARGLDLEQRCQAVDL